MTSATRDILAAFDNLAPEEKQELAAEILRRTAGVGEIPDEGYDQITDALFAGYDAEEPEDR